MEVIFNIVERKCSEEMEAYLRCVNENAESWLERCSNERKNLNACSSKHPIIMKINKKCSKEFQLYDDCLQKNPSAVQKCSAELELFSLCAEAVSELEVDSSEKT